ncbi:MAG TPA: amino acid--[acyl-carrier-protein] ligase [Myxococcaceae bacterium]|nr:amino acid--[acyl-carrier-protein] ligase [Myxococcaceae bacterium]
MSSTPAQRAFQEELVRHRLITLSGVPGVWAGTEAFESVLRRVDARIHALAVADGAEPLHFPPLIPRRLLERTGFLDSFPHLAGTVFCFSGSEAQARELGRRAAAGEPWAELQTQTEVALTPAACYPVYPTLAGVLPEGGRTLEVQNHCFRHEPSGDPARLQLFRMHEVVRVGRPDTVVGWRAAWLERSLALLDGLGLDARSVHASDPFFGRAGKMLAASQKEQGFKFEIVVPIASEEPTAVCSFNYHQDHFGKLFGISLPDGEVAHTACLGFGLERVTLALFRRHGLDPREWPALVRAALDG